MSFSWALLSGSGLARAELDPSAYALDADEQLPSTDWTDATRGTAIHAYIERLILGMPRGEALALCPREVLATCAGINPAALVKGEAEVAFAYNVATGKARRLTRTTHRDYGQLQDTEIPLTLDLIAPPAANHGLALVTDWKTCYDTVEAAYGCLQIEAGAVCVADYYGVEEVETQIGRVDEDGMIHFDVHVMDSLALDAARARIARVHARVAEARAARMAGEVLTVRESQYCKYCPSKGHCPAYGREAMALATRADGWLQGVRNELQTETGAAYWFERYKKAEWILEQLKTELDARVELGPVTLSDGRIVKRVPQARRSIDGKRALPLLRASFGAEIADAAAEVKITLTSIREAFGEDADGVEKFLEASGVIKSPTVMTTRVVKPAKVGKRKQKT